MKESTPLLSLIVVYRDRDIARVTRFLESLANQTDSSFELIFIDYGSSEKYKTEIQALVELFPFVRYYYTNTRGMFWNRSKALNLGMTKVKGQYIVTVDIDLIFPPTFIAQTLLIIQPQLFIQYQCYYLPQGFSKYSQLFTVGFKPEKRLKKTNKATAYGIIAFPATVLDSCGYYDEYFQLWGFEDIEFVERLQKLAGQQKKFYPAIAIYHQWHPHTKYNLPKGWQEVMIAYKRKQAQKMLNETVAMQLNKDSRPALQIALKDQNLPTYTFTYPKEKAFSHFGYQFNLLKSGEFLLVNQTFNLIKNSHSTWLSRFLNYFNQLLAKIGVSYRWVDLEAYSSEVITKQEVKDFLVYFLLNYQTEISDYYFDVDKADDGLYLVVVKK